jgi:hypothetical protein
MYRDDPANTAPEVNHDEQSSYIYSVPDQTPAYASAPMKAYDHPSPATPIQVPLTKTATRRGWKRWWILALLGLLVAVIAGLVGGFIGQAIEKGRQPSSAGLSAPSCPNSTASATTPPPGEPADIVGTIKIPNTGCNFPASKERRRINGTTTFFKANYTTVCNSGWPSAGLLGIWTLDPSDCVEACIKYNNAARAVNRPSSERKCVGSGFLPSWVNRTLSAREQNGPPFNCFLQNDAGGIVSNDREAVGVEVVALCLPGQCDGEGVQ